jgi:predicted alpha/beta-fold hydrolase
VDGVGFIWTCEMAQDSTDDHPVTKALPSTLALRYPRMREFDATFTKNVGGTEPPFPFPTVEEYYRWASRDRSVKDIKVPFLAISSADDPAVTFSRRWKSSCCNGVDQAWRAPRVVSYEAEFNRDG